MNNKFKTEIILEGENVILIPLEKEHFLDLLEAASDPEIWELTSVNYSIPEIFYDNNNKALTDKEKGTVYPFIIKDIATDKIIGTTRFLEISEVDKKLEIGVTW